MPSAEEVVGTQSGMRAAIDAGLNAISPRHEVEFRRYSKVQLEQDGFVFWVATPETKTVSGSLHYATDRLQDEDQTVGVNHVLLNSVGEVAVFNAVSPSSMWLGSWPIPGADPLKIAFAQHTNYFKEADIWHYAGVAVLPALESQILDDPSKVPAGPIVSNSLPIWLAQSTFIDGEGNPVTVPVFPSFLVPDNLEPPYVVAHIDPERTVVLSSAPFIGPMPGALVPSKDASPAHSLAGSQLARDEVRLTLYGFDNETAWQFRQMLIENSVNEVVPVGFADVPALKDAKRPQVEIATLAQKKVIEFAANYYQSAASAVAYRLLLQAAVASYELIGGGESLIVGATTQAEQTVNAEGMVFEQ